MAVTDKASLIEYIKRQLGSPVINIEIADEQIDDVIDDSFDLFREYHSDALRLKWVFIDVTTTERNYTMPDSTFSILDIFGKNTRSLFTTDNEDEGYLLKSAYVGNTSGLGSDEYNATDVEIIRQRYSLYQAEVRRDYLFDYSYLEKSLRLLVDPTQEEEVGILTYSYLDTEDKNYSSLWFRKYCVCMSGLAWAQNIGKYNNINLPGGGSYNYADIFDKYNNLRIELEEQIIDRYSTSFFMDIG